MPFYRWFVAVHVIAIISWMAGLLYVYRLFVYHAAETEEVVKARLRVMERRLLGVITLPAMGAALAVGITLLVLNPSLLHQHWMHAKLGFALGMLFMTFYACVIRGQLALGTCRHSERSLRLLNEVPTVLMVLIVWMVIVRPF